MRFRAVTLLAAALAAALLPGRAATPAAGTLTHGVSVEWNGSVPGGHINPLLIVTPVPELRCLEPGACDEFALTVDLGPRYWEQNGDGAVEVGIRWIYDGVIDLDLQVLDADGDVVAQSVGVDSNAEMVFINNAPDGVYTVRVIPTNTFNPGVNEDTIPYEGLAQVEILATDPEGEGHEMLPNLEALPPDGFHIASAANYLPIPENPILPCYPEETIQNSDHPLRCLRFNQTIANTGEGRLELRFALSGLATPGEEDNVLDQRIFWSDGTSRDVRMSENYEFHAVHAHLHFKGFGQTLLYPWSEAGGRGETPASIGRKVGFCVIDVRFMDEFWGAPGNGPRGGPFPYECFVPDDFDPSGPEAWVVQGVNVGWADVYGWNLADQYIDITGVPDGIYELVQIANPARSVLESDYGDNCSSTVIEIRGDVITTPFGPGSTLDSCPSAA